MKKGIVLLTIVVLGYVIFGKSCSTVDTFAGTDEAQVKEILRH